MEVLPCELRVADLCPAAADLREHEFDELSSSDSAGPSSLVPPRSPAGDDGLADVAPLMRLFGTLVEYDDEAPCSPSA